MSDEKSTTQLQDARLRKWEKEIRKLLKYRGVPECERDTVLAAVLEKQLQHERNTDALPGAVRDEIRLRLRRLRKEKKVELEDNDIEWIAQYAERTTYYHLYDSIEKLAPDERELAQEIVSGGNLKNFAKGKKMHYDTAKSLKTRMIASFRRLMGIRPREEDSPEDNPDEKKEENYWNSYMEVDGEVVPAHSCLTYLPDNPPKIRDLTREEDERVRAFKTLYGYAPNKVPPDPNAKQNDSSEVVNTEDAE